VRDQLLDVTKSLSYGDVTDLSVFGGAVIDHRAFAKHEEALLMASASTSVEVLAGGSCDDSVGYFVDPTVLLGTDPRHDIFTTEYFGPILAIYVYDDADFEKVVMQAESAASYALTGAIIAQDRAAIRWARMTLRFAAGNFYINDKPTGAVVGQQPFGGARASGTNDKAGSAQNLLRWASARTIKETFVPAKTHLYPHMDA
jgi:1-pyrroline-5-carboxylate dehydrogenase